MMIKENKKITKAIAKITKGHKEIFDTLDKLLSRHDKVFKVTVGDSVYEFMPPSDETDETLMRIGRYSCIQALLERSYKKINTCNLYDKEHAFDDIIAFTMGPDPDTLKFEKYEADPYEVSDDNVEDIGTSKAAPLNIENWQVRQELTEDAKNFNPITRRVFDEDYPEDDDLAL